MEDAHAVEPVALYDPTLRLTQTTDPFHRCTGRHRVCLISLFSSGAGEDNHYSLHTDHTGDLFGPNYLREVSDWSAHQHTLMP